MGLACCGLVGLQVMVTRSVSLHLLDLIEHQEPLDEPMRSEMTDRLRDVVKYRLGVHNGSKMELTAFGRFVAGLLITCRFLIGAR